MNDDEFERMAQIEDHRDAIDFYEGMIKWMKQTRKEIVGLRSAIQDMNDFPDRMPKEDTIANVCCDYLIKYLDDNIQDYDGRVRDEQNAIMELES